MELNLLKIIFLFIIGWSGYYGFFFPRKLGYVNEPLVNSLWFLFAIICGILMFGNYSNLFSIDAYILLVEIIIIYYAVLIAKNSGAIKNSHKNYLLVKIFEICFQQFVIVSLISWVVYYFPNGLLTVIIFSIFWGLIHFGILFFKTLGNIRYIYFFLSFVGGSMFYLLVTVGIFGVEIAFLLHYMFYVYMSFNMSIETLKSL